MTELLPSLEATATRALEGASKGGRVYVEGPVGAGRNSLLSAVAQMSPQAVVLELLQLAESDAPAVALLEIAGQLNSSDAWPKWETGAENELHGLAKLAGQQLSDAGRALLIRMPDSWLRVEAEPADDDTLPSRARSLLSGLFQSSAGVVLIADAALTPARLGFHPQTRLQLPAHITPLDALESVEWDAYRDVFNELVRTLPSALRASPLAWRLAVGARALGAETSDLAEHLSSPVPLPDLALSVARRLSSHARLAAAVQRFLAIRRPVTRNDACVLSGIPADHASLILECIGYGTTETRVTTVLRSMLSRVLSRNPPGMGEHPHADFAAHYTQSDGALSPVNLSGTQLRSWCEKTHHLAHAGALGLDAWCRLDLVAPNLYWDKARHLSQHLHDYLGAAKVYEKCVERFSEDDYSWHYLGYNLARAGQNDARVLGAYRKAIDLNSEHPWWNRRYVTQLIRSGKPSQAQEEWRRAVERVDPEGVRVRESPWLAHNLHMGICWAWLRTGRYERARSVLKLIPKRFTTHGPLSKLKRRAEADSPQWQRFLKELEKRFKLTPEHAQLIRSFWNSLIAAQPELPLPIAHKTASDGAFQFVWSYDSLLLEIDVSELEGVYWFGKNRASQESIDGYVSEKNDLPPTLLTWLEKIASA